MGDILSRAVTPATKALAAAFNNLRSDLLSNHNHDGTKGTNVNHGNLIYEAGYTATNTHEDIDDHVAAAKGVHGLGDDVYVMGISGSQKAMVIWETTWAGLFGETLNQWEGPAWITLPVTMANSNYIVVSIVPHGIPAGSGDQNGIDIYVHERQTTQFSIYAYPSDGTRNLAPSVCKLGISIVGQIA